MRIKMKSPLLFAVAVFGIALAIGAAEGPATAQHVPCNPAVQVCS